MQAPSGNLKIFYRKTGKPGGLPVLIVHGLSYTSADWVEVAEKLGAQREVICMDMRGFGESDWSPEQDYSVPSMAQDIVAVLDHAGWKRAVLAGHSMGGRSATWAAGKNPARRRCQEACALVVLGTRVDAPVRSRLRDVSSARMYPS